MNIKRRVLIQTLSASLVFTLVLSLIFFSTIAKLRGYVRQNFSELGSSAAAASAYALEEQVTDKIARLASNTAIILDGQFARVENYTRTTADITGSIYTHKESWRPKPLPYARADEIAPREPYIHGAPGVDLARIKTETDLAGNIANELRQITVVDRGIATSAIGGESGYIIAMDAFPWLLGNFDHRVYSWYTEAKKRGGLYWTEVYLDPRGRGPVVSCAMPYYDSSSGQMVFKGVARSTVMLADFSKIINTANVGRTGYLFLVDQNGLKLFSSGSVVVHAAQDGSVAGENLLESGSGAVRSLAHSMTLGASGMAELLMDGVPVYAAYAPIQTLGWSLGVVIPVQEISSPVRLIEEQIHTLTNSARGSMDRHIFITTGILALLLLLSLGAIALLSVRFSDALSRPIRALADGVREVSGGNLNREVLVKTGDEFELLAEAFNSMRSSLRSHIEEIAKVTAERQRIDTELDVATRIQMSILPNEFPPFKGRKNVFDLFAAVYPAREVGGDFYDFFFIDDDHFACLIADVSGKGIPAALFMAISKTLIKNYLQTGEPLDIAMENANRQLCGNNLADMFVTAWVSVLEISTGRLEYVNAGHNPPLLAGRGGRFVFLMSPPDLVLGGMDSTVYRRRETVLKDGDTLFLYTDGITEAAAANGDFYGKERLRGFLDQHNPLPLRELLAGLRADISAFSAEAQQSDDITMVALRSSVSSSVRCSSSGYTSAAHSIVLRADVAELPALIAFIGNEFESGGRQCGAPCPPKIRERVELAAEEIFVNIARYAYADSPFSNIPGETCEVAVECSVSPCGDGAQMRLEFIDRGGMFNPLEHGEPDITLPLEQREAGGLGVLLVKRVMDTVEYRHEDGKNHLVVTKSWGTEKEEGL